MTNFSSRAALTLGLVLLAAAPIRAQGRVGAPAGVPTHLGGGVPTHLGGGVPLAQIGTYSPFYGNYGGLYAQNYGNLYAQNYGNLFAENYGYNFPENYGYNGVGFGIPYGFGGITSYGGLAVGGLGNGYYGYGGYGGFGGIPSYGGIGVTMGMSPFDQEMLKEQEYQMNAGRANLMNAQAVQAYQSANLMRQRAIAQAQSNAGDVNPAGYEPRYDIATANTRPYPPQLARRNRGRANPALLPREKVLDPDGRILWPGSTPKDDTLDAMRQSVDTAFHDLVQDARTHNRAAIREAVNARDKLYAFGNLALEKFQDEKKASDIPEFQVFLASLDRALVSMASTAPKASTPSRSTTPDNAPRSAGDVLKDTIREKGDRQP